MTRRDKIIVALLSGIMFVGMVLFLGILLAAAVRIP